MRLLLPCAALGALLALAAPLPAQQRAVTLGLVQPTGDLAARRRDGVALGGSWWIGGAHRAWRLRLLGEYWHVPADSGHLPSLHAAQGFATVVLAAPDGLLRVSLLTGLGGARQWIRGETDRYGEYAPAAVAGLGVGVPVGAGRLLRLEARAHVIVSTYGLGEWEWPTARVLGASLEF